MIAEAEPHPPQVPQLRLRKVVAITSPAMAFTGRTPASGRSGEERDSAGGAALGMIVYIGGSAVR